MSTTEQSENSSSILNAYKNELHDWVPIPNPLDFAVDCGLANKNSQEDRIALKKMQEEAEVVDSHVQLPLLTRSSENLLPNDRNLIEGKMLSLKWHLSKDAHFDRITVKKWNHITEKNMLKLSHWMN